MRVRRVAVLVVAVALGLLPLGPAAGAVASGTDPTTNTNVVRPPQ
jgi:hypothetical protein